MKSLDSIEYYNKYASIYFENTVNLELNNGVRERFMELLPEGASILDLGCGSGRDSLFFLENNFDVTPLDGSKKMCELAEIHTDIDVLNMTFEQLDFNEVFDGIWACASLLHVEPKKMPDVLEKIEDALKENGILYISVRQGDFVGSKNKRFIVEYSRHRLREMIEDNTSLKILNIWKTDDVRSDRRNQRWINLLAKKEGELR